MRLTLLLRFLLKSCNMGVRELVVKGFLALTLKAVGLTVMVDPSVLPDKSTDST